MKVTTALLPHHALQPGGFRSLDQNVLSQMATVLVLLELVVLFVVVFGCLLLNGSFF